VARVALDFMDSHHINRLPWPPRSPDLSPIEHVWDIIGSRLLNLQHPPETLAALRHEVEVAWNEIPQEDIDIDKNNA
jgi:transposase